ncbi:MAG: hypothetical protein B6U94_01920 [Thermofilum sp. ex4484_79]|nr:MAG: hypothetical protein B6U94_01920 [Thermofilum sp. ex4484_79]
MHWIPNFLIEDYIDVSLKIAVYEMVSSRIIDIGYVADLVLLDTDDPNLRPLTKHNILSNIVYTASSSNCPFNHY